MMKSRIKQVRTSAGLNQSSFGNRIGVTAAAISRWEAGERSIPETAIISICREFGINEVWLRTGAGDMNAAKCREEEMAELVKSLMSDSPESFRCALVSTLLRFDPNGPEWEILERIYEKIAESRNTQNEESPEL